MARFFVPKSKFQNSRASIDGRELEHMRRVLRFAAGDRVTIFDDSGFEHEAVIRSMSARRAEIEIMRSYHAGREPLLKITVGLGLTKGQKMDLIVEKATELGAEAIIPFVSAYTVPKIDERQINQRIARWQKIALSAAKQCGRTGIPAIQRLCRFDELAGQSRPDMLKLLFWETGERRTLKQVHAAAPEARSVILLVGPEGGFSADEAALAQQHGFEPVQLGRRILRADTAAVAALALVQFLWGDLGVG